MCDIINLIVFIFGLGGLVMKNLTVINADNCDDLSLVVSNKIIEANFSMPIGEQRLLYSYIGKLDDTSDNLPELDISVAEFSNMLGLADPNYSSVKINVNNLMERRVAIESEAEYVTFHWFSIARYLKKEGRIKLKIHDELKPYFLKLKREFTKLIVGQLIKFKSSYATRIYMLLKQYEGIGSRLFEIADLRKMLDIGTEKYKLYGHFKTKILNRAVNEINSQSDIEIEMHEIKKGRKVVEILFEINKNIMNNVKKDRVMEKYESFSSMDIATMLKTEFKKRWDIDFSMPELVRYEKTSMLELLSLILRGEYQDKKITAPRMYFTSALSNIEQLRCVTSKK